MSIKCIRYEPVIEIDCESTSWLVGLNDWCADNTYKKYVDV